MSRLLAPAERDTLAQIRTSTDWQERLLAENPYRIDPATFITTFSLTAGQREHLAGLNDFCRAHETGLLLYAHLYQETCRSRHVAVLSSQADRALQRFWANSQEELIAKVLEVFFCKAEAESDTLEALASRAVISASDLRGASDEAWDAANNVAYEARLTFQQRFFTVTGLSAERLGQLQTAGAL